MVRWDGKMGRGCRCCIDTPTSQRAEEVPLQTHHKEPWAVPEAVPGYPGLPESYGTFSGRKREAFIIYYIVIFFRSDIHI